MKYVAWLALPATQILLMSKPCLMLFECWSEEKKERSHNIEIRAIIIIE